MAKPTVIISDMTALLWGSKNPHWRIKDAGGRLHHQSLPIAGTILGLTINIVVISVVFANVFLALMSSIPILGWWVLM